MRLNRENNSELKNFKVVPIKPFRNIQVGDPSYLEELDREKEVPGTLDRKTKKSLESLVLDTKTSCCKNGVIVIGEIEEDLGIGNMRYSTIEMTAILSCRDDFERMMADYETYATDMHYSNGVKKVVELGCDTAQFDITVDGNYENIHTGGDGYYGYALEMKQYYGFVMELSFDASLFTMDDVENYARYLFKVDKKREMSPEMEQITNRLKEAIEATKEHEELEKD